VRLRGPELTRHSRQQYWTVGPNVAHLRKSYLLGTLLTTASADRRWRVLRVVSSGRVSHTYPGLLTSEIYDRVANTSRDRAHDHYPPRGLLADTLLSQTSRVLVAEAASSSIQLDRGVPARITAAVSPTSLYLRVVERSINPGRLRGNPV